MLDHARSVIAASGGSASAYKPSNGGVVNAFGGFHVNDFLSIQGNHTWNHYALELFAIENPDDSYEQHRRRSRHSAET